MKKMSKLKRLKRAQEEMVGFILIIIIMAIVILIFFSVSVKKDKGVLESYEAESFLQSLLQFTTNCSINYYPNYQDVGSLISKCADEVSCVNGETSCDVLDSAINESLENSWNVGEEWPNKGYALNITFEGQELVSFKKGNTTLNMKGAVQNLENIDVVFNVYS